ncbi:MAG: hypothetical protein JSV15_05510 [Candidatus Bathyarchaeota archaeon]|nr:MAG: hypothetical protein JSV15_05510 [Candidatus Bathyarchaeota archaeon]
MSERIKVLGTFALLGFFAGIAANLLYHTAWPWLLRTFPTILQVEWVVSGLAGALLTLVMLVLWVYLSGSRQ